MRGCLRWRSEGLIPPASVKRATAEWQHDVDHLKMFVEEMLMIHSEHQVQAQSMLQAYRRWCRQNGERHLSPSKFKSTLSETFNLTHTRVHGVGWWKGVKLKP